MSGRSTSRATLRSASLALLVALGCVGSKDVARGDQLAILHGTVDERLGAGSVEIFGTSTRGLESDVEARAMSFESFPTRAGTLLHVSGVWMHVAVEAFALQTGAVVRALPLPNAMKLEASVTATSRFAPIDDGGVFARCNLEGTSFAFLLPHANAQLVALTAADATRLCAGTIGKSPQPGRIATATVVGEKIVLSSLRIDASGTVVADGASVERTPTGQPAQTVFFVEETSPGVFLYAATVTDLWVHERTDDAAPQTTKALVIYPDPRQVRHATSGALQVFSSGPIDRFVEWRVQGDGTTKELGVVPSGVSSGWRLAGGFAEAVALGLTPLPVSPGSSSEPVLEPTEARARLVSSTGDALVAQVAPASPCVVRAACREVGESYLLGVSGDEAARVGVYLLWGWRGAMSILATPLAGRATP